MTLVRLVIATANPGKVREFREMLGGDRFEWSDLSDHPEIEAPEEVGHTFRANACLKAGYYARKLGAWALADDSGLVVDALNGRPGIHSARWAQLNDSGVGDAANNLTLLRQLTDIPDERRSARFICVLALADAKGRVLLTTQDSVEGMVLREPRGQHGFGYDPLFFLPELGESVAELTAERKHAISHRGKALGRLKVLMDRFIKSLAN